jgi:hypothetical protein
MVANCGPVSSVVSKQSGDHRNSLQRELEVSLALPAAVSHPPLSQQRQPATMERPRGSPTSCCAQHDGECGTPGEKLVEQSKSSASANASSKQSQQSSNLGSKKSSSGGQNSKSSSQGSKRSRNSLRIHNSAAASHQRTNLQSYRQTSAQHVDKEKDKNSKNKNAQEAHKNAQETDDGKTTGNGQPMENNGTGDWWNEAVEEHIRVADSGDEQVITGPQR